MRQKWSLSQALTQFREKGTDWREAQLIAGVVLPAGLASFALAFAPDGFKRHCGKLIGAYLYLLSAFHQRGGRPKAAI
jgi:hypothetical protein